jgi:hypothetical protein
MDSPYSAYSAVYSNPNPSLCPQCQQNGYGFLQQQPADMPQTPGTTPSTLPSTLPSIIPSTLPSTLPQNNQSGMMAGSPSKGSLIQPTTNDTMLAPITTLNQPMPMTVESLQYLNGFLRTQIGRRVLIDFLVGTNTFLDKSGTLLGVGANYILIREAETDDIVACDFYNIKFIKFYM